MQRNRAKWPWPPPRRGDTLALLFIAFVLAFVLVGYFWWPFAGRSLWYLNARPGWTCTYPGSGEPVCVKDVPRAAASP